MVGESPLTLMRTVGTANAAPGELAIGAIEVGEDRDGSALGLPVAVINGAEPGRTCYIQAASDGDELNGVGVVAEIVPQIDPGEVRGAIVIVGIVNPHGFRAAEHRNPIDDTKINRTYPGDPEGSASERLAATTFDIAREADIVLDLHQGSTSRMIDECRVRCGPGHDQHGACLELAKVFGCGHVFDQKGPDGQLARVAPDNGIPTIDPELGGSVGWDRSSIEMGVRGVFNVLRHYDLLPGNATLEPQVRARAFAQYGAPAGGLVRFETELGARVTAGDTLFTLISIFGEHKATVTAAEAGVVWRMRRLPQVATGEYVCTLGTNLDTY